MTTQEQLQHENAALRARCERLTSYLSQIEKGDYFREIRNYKKTGYWGCSDCGEDAKTIEDIIHSPKCSVAIARAALSEQPEPQEPAEKFSNSINAFTATCHARSVAAGWYSDPATGLPLLRNVGEMLALIHSEISEALEGYRKKLMDDHIPSRPMIEVELADTMIRIGDLAGHLKLDLGGAIDAKMEYNLHRADHKPETRKDGGKAF